MKHLQLGAHILPSLSFGCSVYSLCFDLDFQAYLVKQPRKTGSEAWAAPTYPKGPKDLIIMYWVTGSSFVG